MGRFVKNPLFNISQLTLLILIICSSCSSKKIEISKEGNIRDAINSAIIEYSEYANKKHRDKSAFFVNIEQIDANVYSFSISPSSAKRIYNEKYLKDSDIEKLPTNYYVINDQLYYWWEDGVKGKKKDIEIFKKYEVLVEDKNAFELYVNSIIDERKKLTYYYFCKNDLTKNIKVKSAKNEDYFTIPENFDCN